MTARVAGEPRHDRRDQALETVREPRVEAPPWSSPLAALHPHARLDVRHHIERHDDPPCTAAEMWDVSALRGSAHVLGRAPWSPTAAAICRSFPRPRRIRRGAGHNRRAIVQSSSDPGDRAVQVRWRQALLDGIDLLVAEGRCARCWVAMGMSATYGTVDGGPAEGDAASRPGGLPKSAADCNDSDDRWSFDRLPSAKERRLSR